MPFTTKITVEDEKAMKQYYVSKERYRYKKYSFSSILDLEDEIEKIIEERNTRHKNNIHKRYNK